MDRIYVTQDRDQVVGRCEYGHESWSSMKVGEFLQ